MLSQTRRQARNDVSLHRRNHTLCRVFFKAAAKQKKRSTKYDSVGCCSCLHRVGFMMIFSYSSPQSPMASAKSHHECSVRFSRHVRKWTLSALLWESRHCRWTAKSLARRLPSTKTTPVKSTQPSGPSAPRDPAAVARPRCPPLCC